MTLFWILWTFNALMALVPLYFFFVGLGDGSINARNLGLWALILLLIAAIVGGTLWLKSHDHLGLAKILLSVAAIPGIFFIFYMLIVIIGKPRWN